MPVSRPCFGRKGTGCSCFAAGLKELSNTLLTVCCKVALLCVGAVCQGVMGILLAVPRTPWCVPSCCRAWGRSCQHIRQTLWLLAMLLASSKTWAFPKTERWVPVFFTELHPGMLWFHLYKTSITQLKGFIIITYKPYAKCTLHKIVWIKGPDVPWGRVLLFQYKANKIKKTRNVYFFL